MHFLLTNDDGIDAPGLAALEAAIIAMGGTATVVAPAVEQSQCGHRVTTREGSSRAARAGMPCTARRPTAFASPCMD